MWFLTPIQRERKGEKGSLIPVFLFIVLISAGLLWFVVKSTRQMSEKIHLQAVADASALAGANVEGNLLRLNALANDLILGIWGVDIAQLMVGIGGGVALLIPLVTIPIGLELITTSLQIHEQLYTANERVAFIRDKVNLYLNPILVLGVTTIPPLIEGKVVLPYRIHNFTGERPVMERTECNPGQEPTEAKLTLQAKIVNPVATGVSLSRELLLSMFGGKLDEEKEGKLKEFSNLEILLEQWQGTTVTKLEGLTENFLSRLLPPPPPTQDKDQMKRDLTEIRNILYRDQDKVLRDWKKELESRIREGYPAGLPPIGIPDIQAILTPSLKTVEGKANWVLNCVAKKEQNPNETCTTDPVETLRWFIDVEYRKLREEIVARGKEIQHGIVQFAVGKGKNALEEKFQGIVGKEPHNRIRGRLTTFLQRILPENLSCTSGIGEDFPWVTHLTGTFSGSQIVGTVAIELKKTSPLPRIALSEGRPLVKSPNNPGEVVAVPNFGEGLSSAEFPTRVLNQETLQKIYRTWVPH